MTPELRRSCLRVATTVNSVLFLNFRSMRSATSSVAFTFREAPKTERKMVTHYSYLIYPAENTHWVQIYSSLWIYIHANGEKESEPVPLASVSFGIMVIMVKLEWLPQGTWHLSCQCKIMISKCSVHKWLADATIAVPFFIIAYYLVVKEKSPITRCDWYQELNPVIYIYIDDKNKKHSQHMVSKTSWCMRAFLDCKSISVLHAVSWPFILYTHYFFM